MMVHIPRFGQLLTMCSMDRLEHWCSLCSSSSGGDSFECTCIFENGTTGSEEPGVHKDLNKWSMEMLGYRIIIPNLDFFMRPTLHVTHRSSSLD
jgi:hypothetical protein